MYTQSNQNNNDNPPMKGDKFAHLKAIAAGEIQAPALSNDVRFWSHEPNNPLIGTILGFDEFDHQQYGKQQTVIVGVPILTGRKRTLRDFNHVEALCLLTFSLKSFNFIDGKNTP